MCDISIYLQIFIIKFVKLINFVREEKFPEPQLLIYQESHIVRVLCEAFEWIRSIHSNTTCLTSKTDHFQTSAVMCEELLRGSN